MIVFMACDVVCGSGWASGECSPDGLENVWMVDAQFIVGSCKPVRTHHLGTQVSAEDHLCT